MHPHRSSALGYASAASAVHSRVYGACTAEAAASETSGLSVGGCPRAWRYFGPYPVKPYRFGSIESTVVLLARERGPRRGGGCAPLSMPMSHVPGSSTPLSRCRERIPGCCAGYGLRAHVYFLI